MSDSRHDTPMYGTGDLDRIHAALVDGRATMVAQSHPAAIGRYQILERIGEGGMGCVYRAQQRAPIERIVALKLIKAGLDSPQVIRRFESERQALAWMDHPHIAKVLDAGADPVSGRPFFVMEYVSGLPITRYCDEHRLNNRRRLELFLQVCDAVAHAHQKMIVHRDLKPSNILVASNNGPSTAQTKVIDFGVAKAMVSESDQRTLYTESGQIVGTPEYMSPEQARSTGAGGDGAGIDTRSDIYSLGVVLYELISGALPFDSRELRSSGIAGLERMICDVDPPRPSARLSGLSAGDVTKAAQQRQTRVDELLRELKTELEWIPLKAMRKDRAERYATANELADDVRNYLAGRPLIAAPESRAYRAKKFLNRHKFGVAASAAMILLLIAGITTTTWQAIHAERQRQRAEQQRQLAESRFDDIRNFSANLIGDIHQDVAKLPGSQAAVQKLISIGLQYLQKLNAESSDNIAVVIDASIGYQRLGNLQGNRLAENKVDIRGATASYEKSRELAQRAIAMNPSDPRGRSALATAQMRLGDVRFEVGDYAASLVEYDRAAATLAQIAAANPTDFDSRYNAVTAQGRIAKVQENLKSVADAKAAYARQIALARELLADFPAKIEAPRALSEALTGITEFHSRMGDSAAALASATESVAAAERVVALDPADFGAKIDLSESIGNLARIYQRSGDIPKAIEVQARGLDILRDVRRRDPESKRALSQLAMSQVRTADLAAAAEKFDDAERAFREAIAGFRELLAVTPDDRQTVRMLLYSQTSLAGLFAARKRTAEAIQLSRDAVATLEPLTKAEPNDRALNGGLAFILTRTSRYLLEVNQADDALDAIRRAHEINLRISAADPSDAMMAWNVVDSNAVMGDVLVALNRRADARTSYMRALELIQGFGSKQVASNQQEMLAYVKSTLADLDAPATSPATSSPATAPAGR